MLQSSNSLSPQVYLVTQNPKGFNIFFFFPLSWKGSHKTLKASMFFIFLFSFKLNWKGFGLGLIVELNKEEVGWINYTDLLLGDSESK